MRTKKLKVKKPKKPFVYKLKNVAIICLLCYSIVVLVFQQIDLSQKKEEVEKIKNKVEIAQQQNDEYQRLLDTNTDEYMEQIAIGKLGYAYPDEVRVYDTSKN